MSRLFMGSILIFMKFCSFSLYSCFLYRKGKNSVSNKSFVRFIARSLCFSRNYSKKSQLEWLKRILTRSVLMQRSSSFVIPTKYSAQSFGIGPWSLVPLYGESQSCQLFCQVALHRQRFGMFVVIWFAVDSVLWLFFLAYQNSDHTAIRFEKSWSFNSMVGRKHGCWSHQGRRYAFTVFLISLSSETKADTRHPRRRSQITFTYFRDLMHSASN